MVARQKLEREGRLRENVELQSWLADFESLAWTGAGFSRGRPTGAFFRLGRP